MIDANKAGSDELRLRALYGDDMPISATERNKLLRVARHLRALRAWIRPGSYAWWRLSDDLRVVQRDMLALRRQR